MARRAERQFGIVSLSQVLGDGLSRNQVKQRTATGRLRRILPGVYVLAGTPIGWKQRLMAAMLWAGPDAVVYGRSAARLLKLEGFEEEDVVEVALPRSKRASVSWIGVRCIKDGFEGSEVARIGPFRITTASRTLLDLAALVEEERLEYALEDALRRRLTSIERLIELLQRRGRKGVRGTKPLRALVAERGLGYVPTRSQLEVRVLRIFRRCDLPRPAREFEVRLRNGQSAYLDFAYPELKLAIEVDGYRTHGGALDAWQKDLRRDNELKELGWIVLHFSWHDVRHNPKQVEATIRRFLQTSLPFGLQ